MVKTRPKRRGFINRFLTNIFSLGRRLAHFESCKLFKKGAGPDSVWRAHKAMDPLQTSIDMMAGQLVQIKGLILLLTAVISIGQGLIIYLFIDLRKTFKSEESANDFKFRARHLLNINDLDGMIGLALERISQYPGELFAHWYLGQAYYRKKQWHKALYEFNFIYEVAPSWRSRFVNPFIMDIKDHLQNSRLEIIKH